MRRIHIDIVNMNINLMMTMNKKILVIIFPLLVLVLVGCREEVMEGISNQENKATICLMAEGMPGGVSSHWESMVNNVYGFRFVNGLLVQKFEPIKISAEGSFDLHFAEKRGTLVLWANATGFLDDSNFTEQVTTEEEFMMFTAMAEQMSLNGLTMTASVDLDNTGSEIHVQMKRALARIDLKSEFEGVKVRKVTIHGIFDEGYVNDVAAELLDKEPSVWVKEFAEEQATKNLQTIFYPCGQPKGTYQIEVEVSQDGAWRKLTTALKTIERNTIYTIKIYGNGSTMGIAILEDDWQSGDGTSSDQLMKGLIDVESSVFSEDVRVNDNLDTLFLPYVGSTVSLVLKAIPEARVEIKGNVDGLEIRQNTAKSLVKVAGFNINAEHRFPGRTNEYMYLDVWDADVKIGRVVIMVEANPIRITGHIELDENGVCDFNRYIDGDLGSITLPEGKTVNLRFPEGERQWARLVSLTENTYRVEGGWKPNDPEADGRLQQMEMVVADANRAQEEVYRIIRRNWGLPVVNINGTWWCRYNLRGNVKRFEDQITVANDPVGPEGITEYLKNCSDEEFLAMVGDQYQAGNQDGLKLKVEESNFLFEGFNPANQTDFGSFDPESMAPDGYTIPDYQDYRFFTWNESANLGYGSNVFNNLLGQRISYSIIEKDITIEELNYGVVHIYDYVFEGEHWVLIGLGHQYNATAIARMSIIFATYGRNGKAWMMEGYRKAGDGRGNWYKYASHNAQKTRMIRCIKTPVEYIYE